jgi:hypothetical protein
MLTIIVDHRLILQLERIHQQQQQQDSTIKKIKVEEMIVNDSWS